MIGLTNLFNSKIFLIRISSFMCILINKKKHKNVRLSFQHEIWVASDWIAICFFYVVVQKDKLYLNIVVLDKKEGKQH